MWFYALRNQQQGPVSESDLKMLLKDRTIDGGTLVWKEGMAQWTPAGQVPALAGIFANVPPPLPPNP